VTLLPAPVRARLAERAEHVGRGLLADRAAAITLGYKGERNSSSGIQDAQGALAYALTRGPATFAAVRAALLQIGDREPKSLLDLGAGAGAATLAALDLFPSLTTATLVDINRPMLRLAEELIRTLQLQARFQFKLQSIDFLSENPTADIVLSSYVLVEFDQAKAAGIALAAYGRAANALVLVEPGTPAGFERLRSARAALIAKGGHVAAPCTHHAACPRIGDDWCHFRARVQRGRDHRLLKRADAPFEDEPYSYLVVLKKPASRPMHRVVGPPKASKVGVELPLCGLEGLSTAFVPARDKARHRLAKRLTWGDPAMTAEGRDPCAV
jgi:ribosomal protein RSM22 (predicted rRNA methylase)